MSIVPVAPQQARCALQGGRNDHEHGEKSHEAQNRPGAREAESVGKLPEVCVHEDEEYRHHEHGQYFRNYGRQRGKLVDGVLERPAEYSIYVQEDGEVDSDKISGKTWPPS